MRKQYDCIDAAKLFMSLCVLAIHADLFKGVLSPTIRLAVPIFFIFTGFFFFSKLNKTSESEKKKVLWSMEKRYIQLYLFWFIVLLPITIYYREYYTYGLCDFVRIFLKELIFGSTFRASWYLMACMLGTAIVYWLSQINQKLLIFLGIAFYLFATFASKYHVLIQNDEMLSVLYSEINECVGKPYNNFFVSIMYLTIGKMIVDYKMVPFKKTYSILGLCICYSALLCEFLVAKNQFWFQYNSDCWFMLAPTATFFVLFVLELDIKLPHTRVMRSMSTIIYCSHLTIMMVVKKIFLILNITYTPPIIFLATLMCVTVLSFAILKLENIHKFRILQYSH